MHDQPQSANQESTVPKNERLAPNRSPARPFLVAVAVLLLLFSLQIFQVFRFALGSELYSYIILIPFASAYLVWTKNIPLSSNKNFLPKFWPVIFFLIGTGLLGWFFLSASTPQDSLALSMSSLVMMLAAICGWFLDRSTLRDIAFPLAFLLLLAPLPMSVEANLETLLQHGSSIVAQMFFQIIGTPVFRDGTNFLLPNGFPMRVAPECSGIHSTVALLITSLVAGQVLLRSNWNRAILALIVIPIALLRNGLRVTVIGELCVRIGPEMIDSYIHRHGGPIFFALSLIPFTLGLFFLLKLDRKNEPQIKPTTP